MAENKYDFSKLEQKWEKLESSKKYEWFDKHLYTGDMGNNTYEIVLLFKSGEAKDAKYVIENSDSILDDYSLHVQKEASILMDKPEIIKLSAFSSIDDSQNVDPSILPKKYAIVGFILGAFAGTAILCVLALRKGTSSI